MPEIYLEGFGDYMTINNIKDYLNATILCCEERGDDEVRSACGSDMMSDVLAYVKDQAVLLTGLLNPQVVRTAEMMDIICIVFVRGKSPDEAIIELAKEMNIAVLTTPMRMFEACGVLYSSGLKGGKVKA